MIHLAFFASLGQGKKQLPALSTLALLSFQAPVQFSQILLIHFCPKLLFMRQTSLFSRFWFCPADPYTFFLIPVSDPYNTASPHISRADTLGPSLSVGPIHHLSCNFMRQTFVFASFLPNLQSLEHPVMSSLPVGCWKPRMNRWMKGYRLLKTGSFSKQCGLLLGLLSSSLLPRTSPSPAALYPQQTKFSFSSLR